MYMPNSRNPATAPFNLTGYLLLAVGMVALTISLDGLADLGLQHAIVIVLLVLSFACFVAYGLHSTRVARPIFSLERFKIHTFSIGLLGNLFARIGSGAMPYLIPLLLQASLGYTAFQAGLMMLPVAAAGMASKRLVTQLIEKHGYRRVLVVNTVLVGLMMASFSLMSAHQPLWLRLVQLAIRLGQFDAVHRDEHAHTERPRHRRREQRQQPVFARTDAVDEPGQWSPARFSRPSPASCHA